MALTLKNGSKSAFFTVIKLYIYRGRRSYAKQHLQKNHVPANVASHAACSMFQSIKFDLISNYFTILEAKCCFRAKNLINAAIGKFCIPIEAFLIASRSLPKFSTLHNMLSQNFIALDLETTGLDPDKDEIINIALVRFENGDIAASLDFIVKPQKELSSFVNYLTGISQSELNDAKTFKEIAPQILEFINDLPLVAHNAAFDSKLFTLALNRNGFKNKEFVFWDSLAIAQAAWTFESHKLVNLVKFLNIEVSASHRALPDAEACGKVFLLGLAELEKCETSVYENLQKMATGTTYEPLFKREEK